MISDSRWGLMNCSYMFDESSDVHVGKCLMKLVGKSLSSRLNIHSWNVCSSATSHRHRSTLTFNPPALVTQQDCLISWEDDSVHFLFASICVAQARFLFYSIPSFSFLYPSQFTSQRKKDFPPLCFVDRKKGERRANFISRRACRASNDTQCSHHFHRLVFPLLNFTIFEM